MYTTRALEFRELISKVLKDMGRHSEHAVELLLMIAAHESALGRYRRQIGGPALGIFQIEPPTHDSIWDNCDSIGKLSRKLNIKRNTESLVDDDVYSVFVARCYLLMDTKPLPTTLEGMAKYAKSYWNRTGKATPEKYLEDYKRLCLEN